MYSVTNFIKAYISTDTCLDFQDSEGRETIVINICKYLDLGSITNTVWITLTGSLKYNLNFPTENEAKQAVSALRSVIDSLYPNCSLQTPIPPISSYTPLSVTVAQYLLLISSNTVAALQWYDISDPTDQFGQGVGEVYRVLPKSINDSYPDGVRVSTDEKVFLDFVNLQVEESLLVSQHIKTSGESNITTDNLSSFLTATNSSELTSVNSNYIEANHSILNVDTCENIIVINSKVILANSNNIVLRNIIGVHGSPLNLSSYIFNDIQVDTKTSIGSFDREYLNVDPNEVLYAYSRSIYQVVLPTPLLTSNLVKLLDNPFYLSNATFKFLITTTLNGYSLTIKDKNGVTLKVITDAYLDREVSFIYNNQTGLFELDLVENTITKKINITVGSNGQTTFSGVTLYPPVYPQNSILLVNGVEQRYQVGMITGDYYFNNSDLIWCSSNYILETTDRVELIYT